MQVAKAEGLSSAWCLQWRCDYNKDVAVGWEAWCCSSLCPTRSCMDVLEISPDCWGVMLSHSNNYSSWMNCLGHGVQLVKTLVAHTAGR